MHLSLLTESFRHWPLSVSQACSRLWGGRAAPAVTGEESKARGSKRLSCPYTCLSCVSGSGGGGWRKRQEAGGRADGFMENLPVPSDSQMRFWLRKGLKHICYHMFLSPEINIILDSVWVMFRLDLPTYFSFSLGLVSPFYLCLDYSWDCIIDKFWEARTKLSHLCWKQIMLM